MNDMDLLMENVFLNQIDMKINGGSLNISKSDIKTNNTLHAENLSHIVLKETKITGTSSLQSVIEFKNSANIKIHTCSLNNHTSKHVIKLENCTNVSLVGTNFTNNKCKLDGCALMLEQSKVIIRNCNFRNNTAPKFGGAILINSLINKEVTIKEKTKFSKNKAQFGAAIFIKNQTPIINETVHFETKDDDVKSNAAHIYNGSLQIVNIRQYEVK